MSNLIVNNINGQDAAAGKATAWANYGAAIGAINCSVNISSVTDNGTGDYTFNFANSFADEFYAMSQSSAQPTAPNAPIVVGRPTDTAPTVNSRRVIVKQNSVLLDFGSTHVVFHGDLA